MESVLLGSSVLGGFIGGIVALLAPCCVTVLLPSYFAATFKSVSSLLHMTFLFAAGIAVVILPIALGLAALGALFSEYHTVLFLVGGAFLLALGVMTLRGRGFELPFAKAPAFDSRPGASIFALGVFSGAASSCCAPVLIGVLTLTALTTSFPGALAVSLAYVFGMVFPLFLLALVGDRFGWSRSRLVRGTMVTMSVLGRRVSVHSTNLIGGVLFLGMGIFVLVLAITGNEFLSVPGLTAVGVTLRQLGDRLLASTAWLPGIVALVVLVAIAGFFWWQARRARRTDEEMDR
ncbi:MAG: cytochrome c biogenesis protein CcdA [Chloroflexi bacterium]|nr:cytochrome c biogenesis protein CcdA [Chloroflexota bacterium]